MDFLVYITYDNLSFVLAELSDGVKLCALVAALQGKPGIRGMKPNPKNRHQMIENVTLALQAAKHDKLKIVNIGRSWCLVMLDNLVPASLLVYCCRS